MRRKGERGQSVRRCKVSSTLFTVWVCQCGGTTSHNRPLRQSSWILLVPLLSPSRPNSSPDRFLSFAHILFARRELDSLVQLALIPGLLITRQTRTANYSVQMVVVLLHCPVASLRFSVGLSASLLRMDRSPGMGHLRKREILASHFVISVPIRGNS